MNKLETFSNIVQKSKKSADREKEKYSKLRIKALCDITFQPLDLSINYYLENFELKSDFDFQLS